MIIVHSTLLVEHRQTDSRRRPETRTRRRGRWMEGQEGRQVPSPMRRGKEGEENDESKLQWHSRAATPQSIDAVNQKVESVIGPAGERGSISRGARSWKSVQSPPQGSIVSDRAHLQSDRRTTDLHA